MCIKIIDYPKELDLEVIIKAVLKKELKTYPELPNIFFWVYDGNSDDIQKLAKAGIVVESTLQQAKTTAHELP